MNFETFYHQSFDRIFNYVFRRTLSYDDALDIVQDSFTKLYRRWAQVSNLDEKALLSYLYKTAYSTTMDHFRQHKKAPLPLQEETATHQPDWNLKPEFHRLVSQIRALPEKYRNPLQLKYVEGLEYAEMAEILSTKESTLRSLIKRGLDRLRAQLGPENQTA